jgi:predicted aspartyl protease
MRSNDASAVEGSRDSSLNKQLIKYVGLFNKYFTKNLKLSRVEEEQRRHKRGSNTWQERKAVLLRTLNEPSKIMQICSTKQMIFDGYFEKSKQTFLFDSGCTTMVVSKKIAKQLGLPLKEENKLMVEFANNTQGWLTHSVKASIRIGSYYHGWEFWVCDIGSEIILGLPFLQSIKITMLDWNNERLKFKDMHTGKNHEWHRAHLSHCMKLTV